MKKISILALVLALSACGITDKPLNPKEILNDATISVDSEGVITGKFEYREYLAPLNSNGVGKAFESYSTKKAAARLLSIESYEKLAKADIKDFPMEVNSQAMSVYGYGNLHKGIWAANEYEFVIGIPNSDEVKDYATYSEESPLGIDPHTMRLYSAEQMKNQDGTVWTAYYFCRSHVSKSTCLASDENIRWVSKGNWLHKHSK